MFLDNNIKKQIKETTYLSVDNTWRYRAIIRIMYKKYESMKYWLSKEDIYEELSMYKDFKDYNIETLQQDLESLAGWNNLETMYDLSKMKTVDEFKNKKYNYQISTQTVEIERMLIKLENMKEESRGSLESKLVERFKDEIMNINYILSKSDEEIYDWWERINRDFKLLNENYKDFISTFYSAKTQELMKTTQFLIFKEKFITYLRNFIRELQENANTIKYFLEKLEDDTIDKLIEKVVNYKKNLPRFDEDFNVENFREYSYGKFFSIKEWFLGRKDKKTMVDELLDSTTELIRKITRYAVQLSELKHSNSNRKEEYKKILELFSNCKTIDEANKVSSVVFGVFAPKHITGDIERSTENINSSIYEEKYNEVIVKPRNKSGREKTANKTPMEDKSKLKEEKIKMIMEERRKEQELIEKLIDEGNIKFGELKEITKNQRKILLRWLSKARNNKNFKGKTEYGKQYKISNPFESEYIILKCEDGEFKMPNYTLSFDME